VVEKQEEATNQITREKTMVNEQFVDVSSWQIPSKWTGSQWGIMSRATYGARLDTTARDWAGVARMQNASFGHYAFVRQNESAEAQTDAFIECLHDCLLDYGDYYPVLDLEENTQYDGPLDVSKYAMIARDMVEALLDRSEEWCPFAFDPRVTLYGTPGLLNELNLVSQGKIITEHVNIWVAHWTKKPGKFQKVNGVGSDWAAHQYAQGGCPCYAEGIAGVDLNIVNHDNVAKFGFLPTIPEPSEVFP